MSSSITGRPTVITYATVQKLEQALRDGFSVERACQLSGISRSTYYAHSQDDPDFSDKMVLAQSWATERAKQVIIQAINKGDLKAAQWWLERKARNEFGANPPAEKEPEQDLFAKLDPEKLNKLIDDSVAALAETPEWAEPVSTSKA